MKKLWKGILVYICAVYACLRHRTIFRTKPQASAKDCKNKGVSGVERSRAGRIELNDIKTALW